MDEQYLTVVDEEGNEMLCEIIYTFHSEDYDKFYVLYVPVETEEDEEVEVFCSTYIPTEDGLIGDLSPIETDEEWDMIEETFNTLDFEDYDDEDDEDEGCCGHNHDEGHECHCHDDDE